MVLAQAVRDEVEEALLIRVEGMDRVTSDRILQGYERLLDLTRPHVVAYPSAADVAAGRHLIRHVADVPVLLSAIESKPDWLLTNNVEHFTEDVAKNTGLRIATPKQFFSELTRR